MTEEVSNRALIYQRMDRWRRDLDSRFAKARLIAHCGAPDPNFNALADELRTFRYCLEVLASRNDGEGDA